MEPRPPLRAETVEKALTTPATRKIVSLCIKEPLSVKDISSRAELPLASAYRQVKALVADGILVVERSALTDDGKVYDLYRARIKNARIELEGGEIKVTWDLNQALEDKLMSIWNKLGR